MVCCLPQRKHLRDEAHSTQSGLSNDLVYQSQYPKIEIKKKKKNCHLIDPRITRQWLDKKSLTTPDRIALIWGLLELPPYTQIDFRPHGSPASLRTSEICRIITKQKYKNKNLFPSTLQQGYEGKNTGYLSTWTANSRVGERTRQVGFFGPLPLFLFFFNMCIIAGIPNANVLPNPPKSNQSFELYNQF